MPAASPGPLCAALGTRGATQHGRCGAAGAALLSLPLRRGRPAYRHAQEAAILGTRSPRPGRSRSRLSALEGTPASATGGRAAWLPPGRRHPRPGPG